MKIRDVLSKEEIKALCTRSNWRGVLDVTWTWGVIAGSLALAGFYPAWYTILLAVVLVGGRQLALAILMHEASHKALFASKRANEFVGNWLCAAPMWLTLGRYRGHHIRHHSHTASEKDPDLGLAKPFPVSLGSLLRKVGRDLTGLSGLRRVIGLLMMDLGLLTYSASNEAAPVEQKPSAGQMFLNFLQYTGPMILTNLILFALLALAGIAWVYGLWVIAWLTTFSLFARVRSAAEHACVEQVDDPFRNTRTVQASILARMTVAPHHVNYHLEHHLLMTMPHHNLPKLHKMLKERGALENSPQAEGYFEVFALLIRAHRDNRDGMEGA